MPIKDYEIAEDCRGEHKWAARALNNLGKNIRGGGHSGRALETLDQTVFLSQSSALSADWVSRGFSHQEMEISPLFVRD